MARCQHLDTALAARSTVHGYLIIALIAHNLCSGITTVTIGDSRNQAGEHSLAGDLLCLLSALFYSAYTVAIRKTLPSDDHADVSVFFGLIGVINLFAMAPVLLMLWLLSAVHLQGVTAWLIFLAICKGEQCMCIPC